ncbi:hypothetical protein GWI33_018454 [Rhynchophorus ferrugineus]|uniref:Uncharacterized protein n=1 Tax=Rhynchophorus ferrugineus TaxID=354439 RepID=A0A834HTS9_RHYFE|nr:hypothetical protein GWI33_018454 [Rhynchophorus ferrugineus]
MSRKAENVALVCDSVAEFPETSIQRHCSQLHISTRSLRRILKIDLKIFPYKIQLVQKLLPEDFDLRIEYKNIRHNIEEIQPQMLQDVMKNALKRAESFIANRGHHLANIMFQS